MNRFDDDTDNDNIYPEFGDNDEGESHEEIENTQEYQAFLRQQEIDMHQINLANRELNQKLLKQATGICQASFWWRFKSTKTKLSQIEDVYVSLLAMALPYEEDEDEE